MRVLIAGGCKQGKSTLAQRLATRQGGRPFYVATMCPRDAEDAARIARHRAERAGLGFETVECPVDIGRLIRQLPGDASVLLDSTTALLAEEMFSPGDGMDVNAPDRVRQGLLAVLDAFAHIIVVSDTIDADGIRYDDATEAYRRGLAEIDRALARRCDAVVEMVYGNQILHKGDERVAAWLAAAGAGARDGAGPVHGVAGVRPLG